MSSKDSPLFLYNDNESLDVISVRDQDLVKRNAPRAQEHHNPTSFQTSAQFLYEVGSDIQAYLTAKRLVTGHANFQIDLHK